MVVFLQEKIFGYSWGDYTSIQNGYFYGYFTGFARNETRYELCCQIKSTGFTNSLCQLRMPCFCVFTFFMTFAHADLGYWYACRISLASFYNFTCVERSLALMAESV